MVSIYIVISIVIVIILILIVLQKTKFKIEHFRTELDTDLVDNNSCLDYVTNVLGWDLDYDIDKHLPPSSADPSYISSERRKLINARKSVLEELTSVKSKVYSGVNMKYPNIQACILKTGHMLDYINNYQCQLSGNILSYELDAQDGKYGGRKIEPHTTQMQTFTSFMQSYTNLYAPDIEQNRNQIIPNDGCFVSTQQKNIFYDKITELAKMKIAEHEALLNKSDVANSKLTESVSKMTNTIQMFGISTNVPALNVTFLLQDVTTGLYVNFDGNNNGILDGTGTYLTFQRPSGIYDPNNKGAWALYSASGMSAGNSMRHAGFVVHMNGFTANNFDFSWVFQDNGAGQYTIYNYYGGGHYLDFNGKNVLISKNNQRKWTLHS